MKPVVDFLVKQFLTEPVILIGLLIGIGYILKKEKPTKVLVGTISAMVGIRMVLFGGSQFTSTFRPIAEAVSKHTGIQGYIMDSYAMKSTTQEALGNKFALMGYVFIIAFLVNLILVYFGKYTKAKGVFLTGNAGTAHSQSILWLVLSTLLISDLPAVIISGILVGTYWAYSSTMAIKAVDNVTDGAGFTIGHNQQMGIWFFDKLAPFFGKKEQDAENLKLPGWLNIFNNNVISVCIIMWVFVGAFMIPLGTEGIKEISGGKNPFIYVFMVGINFSMNMIILLTGVRMMCAELTESFKGIQDKVVPNAVPAIDVAALLAFSPNAATLGFIFCTAGTVIAILLLAVFQSPIMVLPGFVPLFFSGGPIGVVANKRGGVKAVVVCCVLLGIIQTFGSVWAINLMNYPNGVGWSGMFDFSTFWPFITEILRIIKNIIE
ncbi:PTS sugar transporter subunit IIC [Clostridiales bacterium COT073_COT-073]|nr:PTS sugar transporter subunit IIC [Clostridiales bacterium COT073_COT-073]